MRLPIRYYGQDIRGTKAILFLFSPNGETRTQNSDQFRSLLDDYEMYVFEKLKANYLRANPQSTLPAEAIFTYNPSLTESVSEPQEVILHITLGSDGLVKKAIMEKGADRTTGLAAVECVRDWKFFPALKEGSPVPMQVKMAVRFKD